MAGKCLEKEEEVTEARRAREEAEERAQQLQQKNRSKVEQNRTEIGSYLYFKSAETTNERKTLYFNKLLNIFIIICFFYNYCFSEEVFPLWEVSYPFFLIG